QGGGQEVLDRADERQWVVGPRYEKELSPVEQRSNDRLPALQSNSLAKRLLELEGGHRAKKARIYRQHPENSRNLHGESVFCLSKQFANRVTNAVPNAVAITARRFARGLGR